MGRAHGAISFVNALPTGVGCAAGVELPVTATVTIEAEGARGDRSSPGDSNQLTPLVRASLSRGLREFAADASVATSVEVASAIPSGRGLKSSSAVAGAILGAVANSCGAEPALEKLAQLASDVGVEVGLSATGAYDDALATIEGGIVVTDNPRREILRRERAPADWVAVLWVPQASHSPAPVWLDRFRREAVAGGFAADLARGGRFIEAMRLNTDLVERLVGLDFARLRSELAELGAVVSGVSGLGPALCAVARPSNAAELEHRLREESGSVLTAGFAPPLTTG